jgi:oligoendopeptidase F
MKVYKSRSEVPDKYKWDLTAFFKNEDEFKKVLKEYQDKVKNISKYAGCTKDADKLYEFIKYDEDVCANVENLYVYAYLVNDQELGVSKSQEHKSSAEMLMAEYDASTSFFAPELLKLSKEEYDKLFDKDELKEYKNLLDRIYRNKEHILSESEELIIAKLTSSMNHFDDMSANLLNGCHDYGKVTVDGEEIQLTSTNYSKLMKNDDREFRKNTREQFNNVLAQYGVMSASFLNSFVKGESTTCEIKKYKSSWDAKLFSNNMPNKAYESLVKVVEDNVSSLQRYYRIFKDVHGLDKLYQYDLFMELAKSNKEYTVEEAQELVFNAISVLGDEYKEKFKRIYDEHFIDYACYKGKTSGGYSCSTSTTDSRILMSFNEDLSSVSTIAHEGGHNVHHQFVKDNNPIQYRNVSSLVSEVASLTNECLLSSYIAENAKTKEEKLAGLGNIIEVINSNLFGAVREAKIEQDFYKLVDEGGTITYDYMNDLTLKSLNKYYGNEVELDALSPLSWIRRSHYYMFFYLYAYSICISVASNVASEILKGNKEMLDNYIKFLSTGSDKWPIEAFKVLGVDVESEDVYKKAIDYYNSLLDEFETIKNS